MQRYIFKHQNRRFKLSTWFPVAVVMIGSVVFLEKLDAEEEPLRGSGVEQVPQQFMKVSKQPPTGWTKGEFIPLKI